jgi:class 3 adenylate cyclase
MLFLFSLKLRLALQAILQLTFLMGYIRVMVYFKDNNQLYVQQVIARHEAIAREQEQLVRHMFPTHIMERMMKFSILRDLGAACFENVTLLFADIAGFTKYSASVSAQKLVASLRTIFTEFDRQCLKHGLFKLYTIGDCYVVMSFVNTKLREETHPRHEAKAVLLLALDMIRILARVASQADALSMRIGMHTGSIIGGVIGTEVVRFDVYGTDVMIANKMESHGLEGQVVVS